MSRAESAEQRAERITAQLRESTREAAGLLKDLTALVSTTRARLDDYVAEEITRVLKIHTTQVQGMMDQWYADAKASGERVAARIDERLSEHLVRSAMVNQLINEITQQVAGVVLRRRHDVGVALDEAYMIRVGGEGPPDVVIDAR